VSLIEIAMTTDEGFCVDDAGRLGVKFCHSRWPGSGVGYFRSPCCVDILSWRPDDKVGR